MDKKTLKIYLRSLLPYILISGIIFSLGIFAGYRFVENYPSEAEELISQLRKTFEPILKTGKISQILFIFLKNGISTFLIIIGGIIFGIFPIIALISNGELLGMLANFTFREYSIFYFLSGVLPHGLIEITCFLISCAMGLKIGKTLIRKIFKKEGNIKNELNLALSVFLKIILIFLFLAAILEVLLTPELLRIF